MVFGGVMKKTLFIGLAIFCLLLSSACSKKAKKDASATNSAGATKGENSMDAIKGKDGVFALMSTTKGDIALELYYKDTPLTVTNFVGLAEGTLDATHGAKFYDGLKFHRVIKDFMIQGGDPAGNGTGGPDYTFADEFLDKYKFTGPGVLAMANRGPATNGSQFFITHVETPWLNGKHTIFGRVLAGQDVVNAIAQGDTIKNVTIVRQGKDAESFHATQPDWDALNKKANEAALKAREAKMASKIAEVEAAFPGFQKTSDGIYYKVKKEGAGAVTGKGKSVSVDYKGYFVSGEVFDKSEGRGPLDFVTGAGQMIKGFDIMVQEMKKGEERTVVLPPDFAYGERGIPGAIPGGVYLAFDITLLKN